MSCPPIATKRLRRLEAHGGVRVDDYYWLRERKNPEVIAYLKAENAYLHERLRHTESLQAKLFEEIKQRIKQKDMSVPYREGNFLYYGRVEEGKEYRIYCRTPVNEEQEQILLDVNSVAKGHDFCDVDGFEVAPSQRILAYAVDTIGRRQYTIRFRDLDSGADLADHIPDVTSNVVWANDNRTLFYTRKDPTTLRDFQIYRHRIGDDVSVDELVYEETDETFSCTVGKSRSKRFVLIASYHTVSTEYRYIDADRPSDPWVLFLGRERDHEYHLNHYRGRFYIRTNANARNFRLMETDDSQPERDYWRELVPHRDDVLLETFELFRDHLVVQERVEGLVRFHVRPWRGAGAHDIECLEPAYGAYIDANNRESDTPLLRFSYSSLRTPESTYDYNMVTRTRTLLKREEVLGGFDSENYRIERLYATAADGARVPISLVARIETPRDGSSPLLLIGYGSYGISLDADFYSPRFSLIDRGFIVAVAHVRGGEDLGRRWYEEGKLLQKRNTFTDFIACAEHLIAEGCTRSERLFAVGGSAGGLLMGAVLNMRPDLFKGVVAHVPFVDVLTTMFDDSIPLTSGEYDEWGDPHDKTYFDYISSYSPYDNVEARAYPHMLVMTGFHDSQVQYWEPAKWVAKLRACKTDDHTLLLRTNMEAGHGGASGRYDRYRELALQYAFLLDLVGR